MVAGKRLALSLMLLCLSSCARSTYAETNSVEAEPDASAVIFLIDKSGSMRENHRLEGTKKAVITSIASLGNEDYIGIVAYDHTPFILLKLQKVELAKKILESRMKVLVPAGKTNLLPALNQARLMLSRAGAGIKHILLLSDGKLPLSGDIYFAELKRLRREGISLSVVALGVEADIPFMKILARQGRGTFYQTQSPESLLQIFSRDLEELRK